MKFPPLTEAEIAAQGLLPAGDYDFEVFSAEDSRSANGNDMMKLELRVYDAHGSSRTVFDYLVATPKAQFKIHGFAAATGLMELYKAGEMTSVDVHGRTGRCKIKITKDATRQYPDKNEIASYIKAPESAVSAPARKREMVSADLDDSIPF